MKYQGLPYLSIIHAVKSHATNQPDKAAVIDTDGVLTYSNLYQKAAGTAKNLVQKGVKAGDYVIVECTQNADYLVLDLACEAVGAIFVPTEMGVQPKRLSELRNETDARVFISPNEYDVDCEKYTPAQVIASDCDGGYELPDFTGEEMAEILFSTGTTGKPKGIMITQGGNVAVAENIIYGTGMGKDAVELNPMPISHSHGLRTCYAHLVNGSTVVVINGVTNVGAFFKMSETYQVNAFDLAPTMAKVLIQIGRKGLEKLAGNIEYIELGTAVLDEATKEKLKEIFSNTRIYNFYGSTEAGRSCILDITKEDFPGCVGYPSKHAQFIITNEKREEIESSKENVGLVAVKGIMMTKGYFGSPELTAKTIVDDCIYTSDLGYFDEKKRLIICGRADDVINYKGIKISPVEIEDVAKQYEGIKDCVCIGKADAVCGQIPVLYVELYEKDGIVLSDYRNYLKTHLEAARVPAKVEVLEELPRSSNGKILKAKLRES